jgi:predicted DNA-binding protein
MKHLTINISEELHTRLKVICTLDGKDMTEVVLKLVEDYVNAAEKRKLIVFPKTKNSNQEK